MPKLKQLPKSKHGFQLAKLSRPKAKQLIKRHRLFDLLEDFQQNSAYWICAPPGYGKSSLVSSFIEHKQLNCLWYRLDEDDTDVGKFFHYLAQASQRFFSENSTLPSFTKTDFPTLTSFARRFFEHLYLNLPPSAVLVYDDCHTVSCESLLHKVLAKSVETLPNHLPIYFLSRELPQAAFAQLRAKGAFSYLESELLQFTLEETQELLENKQIASGDTEWVQHAQHLTDGWPAGLMLLMEKAKQSLSSQLPDSPTQQVIFDYFSQEIFNTFDSKTQLLLAQCALFAEMSADSVNQLTNCSEAEQLLKDLSQRNYFTTSHEGNKTVYYFHPLLSG